VRLSGSFVFFTCPYFSLSYGKEHVFSQSSTVLVRWNFACFWGGKAYCNLATSRIYNGENDAWYMYGTYPGSGFYFLLRYDRSETGQKENTQENLFRERTYDMKRLCSFYSGSSDCWNG
jgi:hypothetical protein